MRPKENDFAPYYKHYVDQIEGDDIIWVLRNQVDEFHELLGGIPEEKKLYTYAPGKWTMAELLGHIVDSERIFAFRALWFARNDHNPLPGYSQDNFIKESNFNSRTINNLMQEWLYLRKSNIILFENFGDAALSRRGVSNNKEVTVLALMYIMAGHLNHHMAVLKEKYL
jgi:hypothetical protein